MLWQGEVRSILASQLNSGYEQVCSLLPILAVLHCDRVFVLVLRKSYLA